MPITINTQVIHASIADVLRAIDPNAEIFDNPTQQGTPYPAWYIVHRSPVERQREVGNRYMLVYQIDIWYMLQQNITRLYDQYTAIAEALQESIEYLPIHGYDGVVVHTHENMWGLELNAMKYSITLRLRCARNTVPEEKMQVIESLDVFLKTHFTIVRIRFVNPKPELDVEMPDILYDYAGVPITLPSVTGTYYDEAGSKWEPYRWSIGGFGKEVVVTENTTAELQFIEIPKNAFILMDKTTGHETPVFALNEPLLLTKDVRIPSINKSLVDMPIPEHEFIVNDAHIPCIGKALVDMPIPEMILLQKQNGLIPHVATLSSSGKLTNSYTFNTALQLLTRIYDTNGNQIQCDDTKIFSVLDAYDSAGNKLKCYSNSAGTTEVTFASSLNIYAGSSQQTQYGGAVARKTRNLYPEGGGSFTFSYFTYTVT